MRRRKSVLPKVLAVAAIVGVGYVVYRYCITEDAKETAKQAVQQVKDACENVVEIITQAQGQVMDDDNPLPNQQATEQQWAAMGY